MFFCCGGGGDDGGSRFRATILLLTAILPTRIAPCRSIRSCRVSVVLFERQEAKTNDEIVVYFPRRSVASSGVKSQMATDSSANTLCL